VFVPKPLYENLPYIYFIISGYLLTINHSWPVIFSSALFYGAACITLVSRSANRRLDKYKDKHKTPSIKHVLPELLYEYLPYGYGAIALFTIMLTSNALFQFIAFTFFVLALRHLLCRRQNRSKAPSLF
jgi:hypothetical protein